MGNSLLAVRGINHKYIVIGDEKPFETLDYKELMDKTKVDCVIVMAPWKKHIEMCIYALEQGIPCGCEVGGTASIEECFQLVDAWERTKTPFMFMENCCYGRREMMVLNMAKLGVFGEIVHCSGGYHHDLRDEIAFGKERRHYRLNEYLTRNCENYPTHEIGPIAQILLLIPYILTAFTRIKMIGEESAVTQTNMPKPMIMRCGKNTSKTV